MTWEVREGHVVDLLHAMPDASVQCVVTSPPYWGLRDYGVVGQLGLEHTPEEYVVRMVEVFREVRRVLREDGTLWLNMGDCYASPKVGNTLPAGFEHGRDRQPNRCNTDTFKKTTPPNLKPKDLVGIPWRVAFALQADGWYLRSDIIWHKPNPMPESVTDRPTKAHEYLFLLAKSTRYYYDAEAIKEPGTYSTEARKSQPNITSQKRYPSAQVNGMRAKTDKQRGHSRRHDGFNDRWDAMSKAAQCAMMRNKRTVWTIATQPFAEAHFATFPEKLVEPCIKAGCPQGGVVLDPFCGSGTTGVVALALARSFLGLELNPTYAAMARRRIDSVMPLFAEALAQES